MTTQSIAQTRFLAPLQQFPLTGECIGRFALTLVDATFLQGLLPPDLELAPNKFAKPGLHPLMFMFDDVTLRMNTNLARIKKEYPIAFKLRYNEFIAMLPYVRFKKGRLEDNVSYCFLPVLYLDDWIAVIGGRVFYEFNKFYSTFDINANRYEVIDYPFGNPLLVSSHTLHGPPVPGSSVPNFVEITPILELPTIEYGRLGYVSSIYVVEYKGQNITPSSLDFTNHSSVYLPNGSLSIPSITQSVMGCFDMTYKWKLSFIKFHPI
jgi:hypothetical protein